ncbi:MAG: hypothetical protein M1818_000014 [Claussenomyces sp. TS43310]|nr:MAG: hypothetical protein M1818_000014 [Claussenomyces sp. TS43310]
MKGFRMILAVTACMSTASFAQVLARADASNPGPPDCSLSCITTIIPEYCNTLTNTTCLCTNTDMVGMLKVCAYEACNITEQLRLVEYQADTCGVVNNKRRQHQQYYMIAVTLPLAIILVIARLFTRIKLGDGLWFDDWIIVAALGTYIADVGTGVMIAVEGFGQHTWYLSTQNVIDAQRFFYVSELFYLMTITLTKLSLLYFFRRLFPNQVLRIATFWFGIFVIASNFSMLMALCFQCVPFHGNWTNWMYKEPPVKCINSYAAVLAAAGLSIFHDCVILIMPLPTLWSLNLQWQKKAHLFIMFTVGVVIIVCSLIRVPTLLKLKSSTDPSYDQAPVAIWTNLEQSVGIMCACLPACRSLVGFFFPRLKMSFIKSSTPDTYGYSNSRRTHNGPKSLLELGGRMHSQDDTVEEGRTSTGVHSEVDLVPYKGKDIGTRTFVHTRNPGDSDESLGEGQHHTRSMGITVTRDVMHMEERR